MEMQSLQDLYVDELKDLWSAENQILKALPKMIRAASHPQLKRAFTKHERQTQQHVRRLERVCRALGVQPRGKKCEGMQGVIQEGADLIQERPDPEVLDAGLIAAAQHVEHYEIAGYGCVRTYARLLGYDDQADLLQQTLDEEKQTDELLTGLAESSINLEAEEHEPAGETPTRRGRGTRGAGARAAGGTRAATGTRGARKKTGTSRKRTARA